MVEIILEKANAYLNRLIGQPLLYAIKSPDTELYDFGFGDLVDKNNRCGTSRKVARYNIHALCRIKVIWQNEEGRVQKFYEDTPSEVFHSESQPLLGKKVNRIALSDKNDLWLDFGAYWMVFATFESGNESWRFFASNAENDHLVASDTWLDLS